MNSMIYTNLHTLMNYQSRLLMRLVKKSNVIFVDEQSLKPADRKPVDCIVLAAGLSSRMGHWKMQLPLGDQSCGLRTILDHSVDNALSFCHRVILVTGYKSEELYMRYQGRQDIQLVHNQNYRAGQTGSILVGLAQVVSSHTFITLGDLPYLKPEVFSSLWAARSNITVFPVYDDQHGQSQQGHPVLISAKMIPALLNADIQRPMKQHLSRNCVHIPVTSPEIVQDIDTPADYFSATGILLG